MTDKKKTEELNEQELDQVTGAGTPLPYPDVSTGGGAGKETTVEPGGTTTTSTGPDKSTGASGAKPMTGPSTVIIENKHPPRL